MGWGAGEFSDAHCPMHRGFNGHCTGGGGEFFNRGACVGESKVMQIAAADEEGSPALTSSSNNGQYIMYYVILYFIFFHYPDCSCR